VAISQLDLWIVGIYAVGIFALAQWVSREGGAHRNRLIALYTLWW
jgi:hypothetical protein